MQTQRAREERLRGADLRSDDISRLRAPIGLDIGAQTPEEIAASIIAEMIAVKYGRSGAPLKDRNVWRIHIS